MRKQSHSKQSASALLITLLSCLFIMPLSSTLGQGIEEEHPPPVTVTLGANNAQGAPSDHVSVQVDGASIRQVLNAFAIQTKRNVVIGPEVIAENVNIHLTGVRWDEALEVILKPYGFGYRMVGDTIVISRLDNLAILETVEPLQSRVYELRYLDAGDVKDILQAQLSPRGSMNIVTARGQKGWKNLTRGSSRNQGGGTTMEMREREGQNDQIRSKTVVVSDVPSVLNRVAETLEKIDRMPRQVLVEARFMEVNEDFLRDIGVEMGGSFEIDGNPLGAASQFFTDNPNAFGAMSSTLDTDGAKPDSYGQITAVGGNWELFISMLEEDEDTETLSAPKILTLNNQEAAIVIGTRYPIISSETTSSTSQDPTISEDLEYYESIGIQLNVVPQICADDYINMVVRPSVTEITGFVGNNDFPIIKTRDTETQILVANGETIVIGGLLEDRTTEGVFKVPFLGDIPLLGRLFRRDTKDTRTVDLLIFLSATIIDEDNYESITSHVVEANVAEEIDVLEEVKIPDELEAESGGGGGPEEESIALADISSDEESTSVEAIIEELSNQKE